MEPRYVRVCDTPDEVAACIAPEPPRLIAVDGFHGSGKTTLARILAAKLGWRLVSADDYLNRRQGGFFEHLRLDELRSSLHTTGGCVFEGICSLKVLRAAQLEPELLIYVKRMSKYGWAEEPDLESCQSHANNQDLEQPEDPLARALRTLWDEVCAYHVQFAPHLQASIFYQRIDA